ncbi:MAG: Ca-activated chloride channel family protein [Planctomycetota bacterium]|jgi:Ca-activated chloride channel family protein
MNSWPTSFGSVTLIDPWMLLWGLLLPLAVLVFKRRGLVAVEFAPMVHLESADKHSKSIRRRFAFLSTALNMIGMLAFVVVLARPAELIAVPLLDKGIDILLCIDKSSSMRSTDMDSKSRRLDIVGEVAKSFVRRRTHDRIGLIGFARYPDLTCPLTRDQSALEKSIETLSLVQSEGPEDATGIGTALAKGAEILMRSKSKSRVIVLLTDGAENVSSAAAPNEIAPIHAAQLCQELGVRVHIVTAGTGVQAADGKWQQLDTKQVELVAEKTQGRFFKANDQLALAQAFLEIDSLETTSVEEPRYLIRDCYLGLLLCGLALVLCSRFLRSTLLEVSP